MSMEFEWDPAKAASNLAKHGVAFEEAASAFLDPMALSGPDPDHSSTESRYVTFAYSRLGQLLAISHTYRPGGIRLISARRVTRAERKLYEEN
jgi:uncharacterized protein